MGYTNIIAGDVSAGTIRLGYWTVTPEQISGEILPPAAHTRNYRSQDVSDFRQEVFDSFLTDINLTKEAAGCIVFAPAGPISADRSRCTLTYAPNISIEIREEEISNTILINDFTAKGMAVASLAPRGLLEIKTLRHSNGRLGEALKNKDMLCAGVGSGYGVNHIVYDQDSSLYIPKATEASHAPLGISQRDNLEEVIAKRLEDTNPNQTRSSWETVLSERPGKDNDQGGIQRVFEILSSGHFSQALPEEYIQSKDKAAWIAKQAKSPVGNPIAKKTMNFAWKTLGRSLQGFATAYLPQGGIYLTSGMVQNDLLDRSSLRGINANIETTIMQEFDSGITHRDWVNKIPVHVVTCTEDGLLGAGTYALRHLKNQLR